MTSYVCLSTNQIRASRFLDDLDDWREQRYRNLPYPQQVGDLAPPELPRVKIAILDTGVDLNHPFIKAAQMRIRKEYSRRDSPIRLVKDFTDLGEADKDGHGTLTTTLLLRVAPRADIYVAKVATGKTSGQCDHIANVS